MGLDTQRTHKRAIEAVNSGRYSEAEKLCTQLLQNNRNFDDAWFLKALSHAGRMDIRAATASIIEALKLSPNKPEYLAQFAKFCVLLNQDRRALLAADHAMQQKPVEALTLDTLGVVYSKLAEYTKAQTALSSAVDKNPENAQFQFNLASAEQFLGNQEQATFHYRKAIDLEPNFARAYWALSELTKNNSESDLIEPLTNLLSKPGLSDDDELYLSHALSREKEKLGDFDTAFELLERGKFRYRSKLNYSWVVDERLFEAISKAFPLDVKPEVDPQLGSDAIFILGMPRSGTTLVDRIVSSHSRVESLGELQNFAIAVKRESGVEGALVLDPNVTAKTSTMNVANIGKHYLQSIHNRDKTFERFIDKTPLNFLQLGYIAESLPGAKIVLLRRNPMDTCLSNFRQLFAVSFSYYNYHYDLVDTGHYFRMFDSLVKKWLDLYRDRIHIVDYESLTKDPEQSIHAMLQFCELDMEQTCLDFHKNKSAVATASAMQVREPIYRGSVARWKKYESSLEPLKAIFAEAKIEY